MKYIFSIFILFIITNSIFANEVNITNENLSYMGKNMKYIQDKNSLYDIDKIKLLVDDKFKDLNKDVILNFFSDSTFWYKFEVKNDTKEKLNRYFVFDLPWIDTINIYVFDKNNQLSTYKLGTLIPFHNRAMKINLLNEKHAFSAGKSIVYLQIKTRDPFIVPFSLLSEKAFLNKISKMQNLEISTYSIITSILIFNIFIFFIVKHKSYLYYVLFLFSFLVASLTYNGYSFKYIYYDFPSIQNWMQSISMYIYFILGFLFSKSFLELKTKLPILNKYTNYVIYLFIFTALFTTLFGYKWNIFFANIYAPLFSFIILYLGVMSYIKGNKNALFFMLATFSGLVGTLITGITALSIINYNWYAFKAVDMGLTVDAILFSIALANRYTTLNKTLQKTEKELLNLNQELELKVNNRTKELNIELKNKSILLKELSHRVKNNLQIMSALLSMDMKKVEDKQSKEIIQENILRIKSISILYENFLEIKNPDSINIETYLEKVLEEIKKSFLNTNVKFNFNSENISLNQSDLIPIGLVINELITNSIKYAFKDINNNEINISFSKVPEGILFLYKDNGVGTDIENLKKGFGYSLLKALILHQLDGEIICQNNNGLQYKITFPN